MRPAKLKSRPPTRAAVGKSNAARSPRVGGHAAAEGEPGSGLRRERALDAQDQRLDDRVLVGGGEVGCAPLRLLLPQVAHRVEQRRFQAGEGEVQAGHARGDREREGGRVAVRGELRQRRAARIAEAEQPCALVERLAGGVVERAAQHRVAAVVGDAGQQRVAAGRDQARERRLHRLGRQEVRRDVALQVVDGRQREPAGGGEPLGGRDPDEQRPHESRALRHGDQVEVVEGGLRPGERVVDDGVDELEVVARGDLRHHAPEAVVHALGGDDVGQDLAVAGDDRRARVVARRLEREDPAHRGDAFGTSSSVPRSVEGVRHITTASSPLSW